MASALTKDLNMNRSHVVRSLALSLVLAASVFAAPVYAQISVNISIAPPAPQYEVVPIIAPGYVWAPGYWGWSGERHVWIRGRTIVQRVGYRWEPDRWQQREQTYYRTAGYWQRDNDYKPVKVKKEKKSKDRGNNGRGERGHDKNRKHGG